MASTKQRQAAPRNVKKAQAAAKQKQTRKNLSSQTRSALGKGASAVRRGDEPTRKELEAEARKLDVPRQVEDGQGRAEACRSARAGVDLKAA